MNFSDFGQNVSNFVEGLNTFLIGVFVVFVTLILLIFIMMLISKAVNSIENIGKKKKTSEALTEATSVSSVSTPEPTVLQDDLELVAVITAAIAASLGTTSDKLQVRSLRKVERKTL
ncbi:hypothetical protein CS063_07465 [Sporanaerobium hydrogeniformans]|uniref:Uncharacterized protein n=1 Tax=Sporanaerobium hydrogeniformans TaxID=3072179 RepID=A0AC61DD40_9FIRM|nr:OadG family protein [Sporanaerobium hydrogeniformans]PHV71160.1 hypothetical protein CS063_07465 [Sporanaerobium hydrogeniformans]